MSAELRAKPVPATQWLSIIGIGEDGIAGLGENARKLVETAAIVYGGRRHLDLAASLISGEARQWPSPFDAATSAIVALRGQSVCVVATGDPMFFGVGATLSRHIDAGEMRIIPSPSAFSLAASRLGWPLQDTQTISLHGRPLALLRPSLHPGRKLLCLTSDAGGPNAIATLLTELGYGPSQLTILEALGGPRETIRVTRADKFAITNIDPLNVVAINVEADKLARVLPLAHGLPDDWFENDGQITKQIVRAATVSALAPRHGQLLWDIGAGSGSIGIEWMLCDTSLRAIAIEANPDRAARIRRNANTLGVPGLDVIEGEAPSALAGLELPYAIFVGGGASVPGVLDAAVSTLRPGGRLVANAVTLETEALLIARHATHGGTLVQIALSHAAPIGSMTGWRPAMPVIQWSWTKP